MRPVPTCEKHCALMAAGGARPPAGIPRQMSRQLSVRAAPGAQLHGKAAQVGRPLPCVWQSCTLHEGNFLKECSWAQYWDKHSEGISVCFSLDTWPQSALWDV